MFDCPFYLFFLLLDPTLHDAFSKFKSVKICYIGLSFLKLKSAVRRVLYLCVEGDFQMLTTLLNSNYALLTLKAKEPYR